MQNGGRGSRVAWACVLLFWFLSAVFFWEPLFTGGILVPTNPRTFQPWESADSKLEDGAMHSNALMSDGLLLTYPWRLYNHNMLRQGEIPFWNPFIFCGYPHLATLQSNALHPLVVVFDLWDPVGGIAYAMALHLGLAGTFMFLFLRRLGLKLGPATFGGVIFELNGFFLVRMSAPSYVFTGAMAPLLFLGVHDLASQKTWRSSWKIILATFLAFLGGHPQILLYLMLMSWGYFMFLLWPELRGLWGSRSVIISFGKLAIAFGLGLGMAGFQLLPFMELVGQTVRGPVALENFRNLALPAVSVIQGIVPDFFGHPVDGSYWFHNAAPLLSRTSEVENVWEFNYCGENLFTGVVPLVFAIYSLFRLRSRDALYFGLIAAVALLVLLGSPLLDLFYLTVPTFPYSRADRIIYVYMFAVSVLAALGYAGASRQATYQDYTNFAGRIGKLFVFLPLAAAVYPILRYSDVRVGYRRFFEYGWTRVDRYTDVVIGQVVEAVIVGLIAVALILLINRRSKPPAWVLPTAILLVVVPLFRFGWRFNPVQPEPLFPPSSTIEVVHQELREPFRVARIDRTGVLPANTPQVFGLFDANGYGPVAINRYARLVEAADPGSIQRGKAFFSFGSSTVLSRALWDYLNVELILSKRDHPLPQLDGTPSDSQYTVYRNPDRLPRFFLVDQVEHYRNIDEGIERFFEPGFDPRRVALVETDVELTTSEGVGPDAPVADSLELLSYGPHEIELAVRVARKSLLVSSEVDYPGWDAFIDGVPVEKVTVNAAFRGVLVPAGIHRVSFRFVARSFYLGLMVSFLSALFALGLLYGRRGDRSSRKGARTAFS